MNFASHNVLLPDGTQTAPQWPLVAETGLCRAALRYMEEEFGPGPHPEITVADLGCMEGGYAAAFAQAGYDVTGIEPRTENYLNAVWLQETLGLPNLRFVQATATPSLLGAGNALRVKNSFDVVFCCGLLYHLEYPVAFLHQLGQVTKTLLILNTHYSMPDGHPESWHQPGSYCDMTLTTHEGYTGHWFHEEDDRWAGFGNRDSFWLTKGDLMEAMSEAGFPLVRERMDWRDGVPMPHGSGGPTADRGMFTGTKP